MNHKLKKDIPYILFVLPAAVIYSVITIIPTIYTFFYSFTNYTGLSKQFDFVGLSNYLKVFTTSNVKVSFINSIVYALTVPVLVTILAIPLAVILNGKMKTRNIQRAIFFFPSVISSLFLGYIWNFILSPSQNGLINRIIISLGGEKLLLLSDPRMAMVSLILVTVWCSTGWHACIYLANLQTISPEYYEAAAVDGANKWDVFKNITVPMLAPAMTTSVMLLITGSLKAFDLPFALTKGGPGYATTMITQTIITEGVNSNRVGFASAMSFVFLILISLFTVLQTKLMSKREEKLA
ncbi:carbohydrate ABC transporter membrane protein 1 (CUT1 family) [Hungatella effluvii]|uniref:Carbohydrate ABC transporter membrane protein 1 (CUT1 family) n=1 Tax=Hungatella effluvii TaxID=1096246 RepID=A0A2V3Y4V8_9FIRM|nr:sugar ABC transporter permease [Hungatella effluvii]PXX52006.1 carbohydrate ABC transporter membrane protein 1 (CUT1 family) [Hungatella effluvii]